MLSYLPLSTENFISHEVQTSTSVTVELSISCSGETVVGVACMNIVCDNEDILTRSSSVSGNHWSLVFHALAHVWHFLLLVWFVHLSFDLLLSFGSERSSEIIFFSFLFQSNECLSLFDWVIARIRVWNCGCKMECENNLPWACALNAVEGTLDALDAWDLAAEGCMDDCFDLPDCASGRLPSASWFKSLVYWKIISAVIRKVTYSFHDCRRFNY